MRSRSALLEDALPPIEIESFDVESPRPWNRRAPTRPAAVNLRPPGYEFIERLPAVAARVRRRYDVTIGAYRDFHPRVQSTVEHRVHQRADDVVDVLCRDDALCLALGALSLVGDARSKVYDSFEHEYRLPIDLHLAWSWPDLPMWLAVGEVSSTKCTLRLSLRSRRRVRYPARYFDAAHAALTGLESRLEPGAARSGSGSPRDPTPA